MAGISSSGIVRVITAGTNVTVNSSDPTAPVVSSTGGGGGITPVSGTFTPVMTGNVIAGSGSYTTQVGQYVKIGPLVWIFVNISYTGHTGIGTMLITGLPFQEANIGSTLLTGTSRTFAYTAGFTDFAGQVTQNDTTLVPLLGGSSQVAASIGMVAAAGMTFTGIYKTNA